MNIIPLQYYGIIYNIIYLYIITGIAVASQMEKNLSSLEDWNTPYLAMVSRLSQVTQELDRLRLCISSSVVGTITPVGHIKLTRETR